VTQAIYFLLPACAQITGFKGKGDKRTFSVHYLGSDDDFDETGVPVSRIPTMRPPATERKPQKQMVRVPVRMPPLVPAARRRRAAVAPPPPPPPPPPARAQPPPKARTLELDIALARAKDEIAALHQQLADKDKEFKAALTEYFDRKFHAGVQFSFFQSLIREHAWLALVYNTASRGHFQPNPSFQIDFPLDFLEMLQELLPENNRLKDTRKRRTKDVKMHAEYTDVNELTRLFGDSWWFRQFSDARVEVLTQTHADIPTPLPIKIELRKSRLQGMYTLVFRFWRENQPVPPALAAPAAGADPAPAADSFADRRAADSTRGLQAVLSTEALQQSGYRSAWQT